MSLTTVLTALLLAGGALLLSPTAQASDSDSRILYTEHSCTSQNPSTVVSIPCYSLLGSLYESLTTFDSASHKLRPALARHWSIDLEAKTIEFELHRNRRWSDGQPVTAQDFITAWSDIVRHQRKKRLSLNSLMNIQGAKALAEQRSQTFSGLSAPNPYRLRVAFDTMDPTFHIKAASPLFSPIPSHVYQQYDDDWADQSPLIVNGLYQLHSESGHDILTPNPYHPEHAALSIKRIQTTQTDMARHRNHRADLRERIEQTPARGFFTLRGVIDADTRALAEQRGWRIHSSLTSSTRVLLLNVNRLSSTQIHTLKCAISSAEYVSRNQHEALIEAKRFVTLPRMALPTLDWQAVPRLDCDAHLKRQAAQHTRSFEADTPTLSINTYFKGERLKSSHALQAMLKPYGITLHSESVDIQRFAQKNAKGDYDLTLFSWHVVNSDPTEFLRMAQSVNRWWLSPSTLASVTQLMNQANQQLGNDRLLILNQAEKQLLEQGGLIPLARTQTHFVVQQALCGFQANSHEMIRYQDLYWCDQAR